MKTEPLTFRGPQGQALTVPDTERTRCAVFSRCAGYLVPLDQWPFWMLQEYRDRRAFDPKATEAKLNDHAEIDAS